MNIMRSSMKSQVLDLKTLPVFSPLKRGVKSLLIETELAATTLLASLIRKNLNIGISVVLFCKFL